MVTEDREDGWTQQLTQDREDGWTQLTQDQKDRLGRRGYALLEMEQANQDPLSHGMEESSSSSRVGEGRPGLQEERSTTGRKKRGGAGTTNGGFVNCVAARRCNTPDHTFHVLYLLIYLFNLRCSIAFAPLSFLKLT